MKGNFLNIILLLSLASLANIDVTDAGSSPHDVCEIYVENFEIVFNQTVASLNQAFSDAMDSLDSVSMEIPPEDYRNQLNMMLVSWMSDSGPKLQAAYDAAASLTGSTIDYINSIAIGEITNPPSPISCLYDMIIELHVIINSLTTALDTHSQLLLDSQLIIGDHRPYTGSGSTPEYVSSSA